MKEVGLKIVYTTKTTTATNVYLFKSKNENCYVDQKGCLKQRTKKQKSDVTHPENSTCKKRSQDLRDFSKMN